jgi:hypothetical protein
MWSRRDVAKASKTQKDRRAVVEQLRREQQRSEKRRTYIVVAVCVAVGLIIIGLGAKPLLDQYRAASGNLQTLGVAAKAAGCQQITHKPAQGNAQHKPIGTTIYYPDSPPAFGPHWPITAGFARKYYSTADRPQLEYLVHNLEHGYTLMWYDQTVANDGSLLNTVKGIASKFQGGQKLSDKFVAVPWTPQDGKAFPKGTHVALTHWSMGGTHGNPKGQLGIWQYCAKPSGAVVASFMKAYPYSDSPEPTLF